MKKNKKILSFILAITLTITITACGNKETTPTSFDDLDDLLSDLF